MLLSKRNFKTQLGNTDLELEAKTGQGLIIKNIMIHEPKTDYITVSISKTTVGYFRVGGRLGSHLSFHLGSVIEPVWDTYFGQINQTTLLDYLFKLGLFTGYPIASGEKLLITGAKQDESVQCVEYEIWESADITPEMENGSKSTSFLYVNYGHSGDNINVETDLLLPLPPIILILNSSSLCRVRYFYLTRTVKVFLIYPMNLLVHLVDIVLPKVAVSVVTILTLISNILSCSIHLLFSHRDRN